MLHRAERYCRKAEDRIDPDAAPSRICEILCPINRATSHQPPPSQDECQFPERHFDFGIDTFAVFVFVVIRRSLNQRLRRVSLPID